MTLPQWILSILLIAATPGQDAPVTTAPTATSPAVAAPEAPATPQPAKLEFPLAGYRINALDSSTITHGVFTMFLPGSGKSRSLSSVRVDRQPTMKKSPSYQFIKDAEDLRADRGDTILVERALSLAEWQMEYTTKADKAGRKEHTYQRMISSHGVTYDISATAPDTQWPELGPKLKACVDSFELSPEQVSGKVAFPRQGYRISKLDGAVPVEAHLQLLSMDGVIVGIEPYTKTLKDYQAEHMPRVTIPNGKVKILAKNTLAENTLVTEYVEEAPPSVIHPDVRSLAFIYEKVVLAHGQLYWATGLRWDWDKTVSTTEIKACVDSLEAMSVPVTASVPEAVPVPASVPAK